MDPMNWLAACKTLGKPSKQQQAEACARSNCLQRSATYRLSLLQYSSGGRCNQLRKWRGGCCTP